jgi:hypothetical protein
MPRSRANGLRKSPPDNRVSVGVEAHRLLAGPKPAGKPAGLRASQSQYFGKAPASLNSPQLRFCQLQEWGAAFSLPCRAVPRYKASFILKPQAMSFQQILDKGSRFERLMQAYLRTTPQFHFQQVWLWNEFPCQAAVVKDKRLVRYAQTAFYVATD